MRSRRPEVAFINVALPVQPHLETMKSAETADRLDAQSTGERRDHPRYPAELRVQLIRSDTVPLTLKTLSLSAGGMDAECDRSTAQLLAPPAGGDGRRETGRSFTARIRLPRGTPGGRALTLRAEVVEAQALDEDRYRVGLRFTFFFGRSRDLLQRFLEAPPAA